MQKEKEWFEHWFDTPFYHILYDYRNDDEARHFMTNLVDHLKLAKDNKIRRVVMCTGKVYYDLYEEREKRGINDIYLLRVEQLYPVPVKALITELSRFPNAEWVWCQEEPKNMGAWGFRTALQSGYSRQYCRST